jgi:hypothetical protein
MASIFCPDCGAKATFTLSKPKFCESCGTRFGTVSSTATAAHQEEVEEVDDIPALSKLEYSIEVESSKTTLGDLFHNPLNPAEIDSNTTPSKGRRKSKADREKIVAQSMAECASRQKPQVTEDGA